MFDSAIKLILEELRASIVAIDGEQSDDASSPPAPYVVAGNIALNDVPDLAQNIRQRVVASVVNIAEEATLKNAPHLERNGSRTRYRNAPAFLNLYLLFSANYENYETALKRLSQVVSFFQGKNSFSLKDSPVPELLEDVSEMRLILELFALTFEQVNYLWASLGGKQMPFVLYKLRLVRISADRTRAEAPVIEEVGAREKAV